ncbi:MAG TPA: aspartyl protease family protein [Candidatus Angelobacter sp.]
MLAQSTTTADNKTPAPGPATASSSTDALKSAQALLQKGKYAEAAAAFKAVVEKDPTSAEAKAGLIRSLSRDEQFDDAEAAAKSAVGLLPQSAPVHAAYGDLYYRLGKLGEAEGEYRNALKLDANSSRGWWGIARIYQAVSMHKHAKDAFAKAHELDPSDPQITRSWFASEPAKRLAGLRESVLKSHSGDAPYNAIASALSEGKVWTLATEIKKIDVRLEPIFQDGTHMSGFGLKVKLNDGTSFVPKLDTGASGLVLGRKIAERAGVIRLTDSEFGGIGDSGPVQGYLGWVEKMTIGDVEFHNCIVEVSSKSDVADDSGLLGGNVFDKFLITIDFKERKLQLAPLPQNPAAGKNDDEAQDRYIAPEMQSYTKVFRFGKDLVIPVVVSDKTTGLFILDTGSFANNVSPKLGQEVTKIRSNDRMRIHGVSGYVKDVESGDKVILQFGGMRVRSDDIVVIDMRAPSHWDGAEISGLIGIRTLVQMKFTIDYRDGLVNFEPYERKAARD